MLGERYAALEPHPELIPWMIEELSKASLEVRSGPIVDRVMPMRWGCRMPLAGCTSSTR